MPTWSVVLKAVSTSPAGKAAAWMFDKVGLKAVVEWAFKAIERGIARIGDRNKAIRKAQQTIDGRWAPVVVENRTRWVVYSGSKPVEIFPAMRGDLSAAMETFDLAGLRRPDDVPTRRARASAKARLMRFGTETVRDVDAEASPQAESIIEALAAAGEAGGQARFHEMVDEMPALLVQLSSAPAKTVAEHTDIPQVPGIYLFSEGVTPIYVGQTRNLRTRLRQHTSQSSRENQAALAWRIALQAAKDAGHPVAGARKDLEVDAQFSDHFRAAKARVAAMNVRFIELGDPVTRTVFEVYAARALGTDAFNAWETH